MLEISGITIFHMAEDGHRTPYFPGMDLINAPQEVQGAAAELWTTESVAAWRESMQAEDGEPVSNPDWEGLVAEVMGNAEFKTAWVAAAAIDPTIAWSLPTAFGMVGQGHPGNFINLFNAICALAQVSPEQRAIWADIGATYNAPPEFLDIVRGQ